MPFRVLPFFRVLAVVLMSALVTGGVAAASSLQTVELTEEICATLDVDSSGTVSEEEAQDLVELGLNLVGEESDISVDEEDFAYAAMNCGDLLPALGTPTGDTELASHPVNINRGTCESLGEIVAPLNDVLPLDFPVGGDATPAPGILEATPAPVGQQTVLEATPLIPEAGGIASESTTVVPVPIDELVTGEHVIAVHQSAVNFDNLIACGDITGEPTDGQLLVQLQELNDSGYSGEALLVANDDGTTTVTVAVQPTAAGGTN